MEISEFRKIFRGFFLTLKELIKSIIALMVNSHKIFSLLTLAPDCPNILPSILEAFDVAFHGPVAGLEGELVAMAEVEVAILLLYSSHHLGVDMLAKVDADVELALGPFGGWRVLKGRVLSEGYEACGQPYIEILAPFDEHLPPPSGRIPSARGLPIWLDEFSDDVPAYHLCAESGISFLICRLSRPNSRFL